MTRVIENELPFIAQSVWNDTANQVPDCPPLTGKHECDVAIVGGGFTGLAAALHLAEAGVNVRLLEAETPGWGASGRNGGQVNPGLKEDPDTILRRFGPDMGKRMIDLAGGAGDFVFDLIRRLDIDCAATQPGWLQPYHDEESRRIVENRVKQWEPYGAPMRLLDRAEASELLGSEAYLGAMVDTRGGHLHPLNYALGLAAAAQQAGATLHGHSRAERFEQTGERVVIHTGQGQLTARQLVIGTNGYADRFAGGIGRTVVPVRSVQVATEPLSAEVFDSILSQGHSASDSRRLLLYFRRGPNNSFVMGGRGDYNEKGTERQFEQLRKASVELYPQLAGAKWRYKWGGFVAMTVDHYPHLTKSGSNVWASMGYNGRGVAMASVMGKVLADAARGIPENDLPFPVTPVRPIPFHFMRRYAVAAAVAWARLRDS
ncbi:NAD(P)/FAD-dependent oxidoreductase [Thalassovita taeanensis]|uniref:Glycine/D-amino acid oxidase n=1 Tax=Thalassovita taeanensis TaxID=657014 RepID=A0A1H9G2C5_9RHOB|nr:FAD-binding oxidoreductase [Thalassovita taeanensis]SEQ44230.1 Glycine/D-amino acid oxidase [Thalassovita taeanensis]